jgi:hypothetical protein
LKKLFFLLILTIFIPSFLFSLTQTKAEQDKMLSLQSIFKDANLTLVESTVLGYLSLKLNTNNAIDIANALVDFYNRNTNYSNKIRYFKEYLNELDLTKYNKDSFSFFIETLYSIISLSKKENTENIKIQQEKYINTFFSLDYQDLIQNLLMSNTLNIYQFHSIFLRSIQDTQNDISNARARTGSLSQVLSKSSQELIAFFKKEQEEIEKIRNNYYLLMNIKKPSEDGYLL